MGLRTACKKTNTHTAMKYYFINACNQQEGPIDVHEFASHGVTDQSFVWCEGMADWKRAGDCDELKSFFEAPTTQIHPSFEETNATTDYSNDVPAPPCHLTAAITGLVLMTIPIPYVALFGGAALGITGIVLNVCAYNFWKKGNYAVMQRLDTKARKLSKAALWVGIGTWIFFIVLVIALACS